MPGATTVLGLPLKFSGALTLRYDYWHNSDLTDTLTKNTVNNGLRQRIRFGVEFADPKTAMVIGGLRLSTGEVTNPTVPFIALGDSFRASSFGLDQAWIAIRPLNDRSRVSIILGRMPNATWRGTAGTLRTEMIWDDDINPAGAALKVKILDLPDFQNLTLENVTAYYQVQETQDLRFVGLTGRTGLFEDQIKLATHFVTGALAFYDWENLNNGLSSPGHRRRRGQRAGADERHVVRAPASTTATAASRTVRRARWASRSDSFRILNPTLQVHVPFNSQKLGNPDVYVLGDYAYNFSARSDHRGGAGITLGTRIGDYEPDERDESAQCLGHVPPRPSPTSRSPHLPTPTSASARTTRVSRPVSATASSSTSCPLFRTSTITDFHSWTNHAQRLFLDVTGEF